MGKHKVSKAPQRCFRSFVILHCEELCGKSISCVICKMLYLLMVYDIIYLHKDIIDIFYIDIVNKKADLGGKITS